MAIKSIISSGQKTEKFNGPVLKVGAGNTLKLTRPALDMLGANHGDYVFIADDDDANVFHVAVSKEEKVGNFKGSKLGIVGDKDSVKPESAPQLQFSHNLLGKRMFDVASAFDVTNETETSEGLTFHKVTIKETREEANRIVQEREAAKAAKETAATEPAAEVAEGTEAPAPAAGRAARTSAV